MSMRTPAGRLKWKCEGNMDINPKNLRHQARDLIEQGIELLKRADELEKKDFENDTVNLKDEMQKIFSSGRKIII